VLLQYRADDAENVTEMSLKMFTSDSHISDEGWKI